MLQGLSRRCRWGLVVVRGESMQPTLRDGDLLLINRSRRPTVGELAIVRFADGEVSVKRVDLIDPNGYFVTRDNPQQGRDSWTLGGVAIPSADVLATVITRVGPPRRPKEA